LLDQGQQLLYIPGRVISRASGGYRGEGKTDAEDAAIIADQARVRRDLMPMRPEDELVTELKVLTSYRRDLVDDRTRTINRLRGHLTGIFPGLEREPDLGNVGRWCCWPAIRPRP
jgi:transposase